MVLHELFLFSSGFSRRLFTFAMLLALTATANAAAIAPNSLSGLKAWYKADALAGLADGAKITNWIDSSGNGYDMLQSEVENQPVYYANYINGLPAIYFDGNQYLSAGDVEMHSISGGMTVLGVGRSSGTGAYISKFDYNTASRQWRLETTAFEYQQTGSAWNMANVAPIPSAKYYNYWQVSGGACSAGNCSGYLNGHLVGNAATPGFMGNETTAEVMIGASSAGTGDRFLGYMSEIMVFSRELSESEMSGVNQYLLEKYAIGNYSHNRNPISVGINFQPSTAPAVPGYLTDSGQIYSQHGAYKYGWSQNAASQAVLADASQIAPGHLAGDQRFNSYVAMHNGDFVADWEIELPNGSYFVRGVYGDPRIGHGSGIQRIQAENHIFEDRTPIYGTTNGGDWDEHWGVVEIKDGRLSLGVGDIAVGDNPITGEPVYIPASGKLCFLEIQEVTIPDIAINFQPGTAWTSPGLTVDSGAAFGIRSNGLHYGWVDSQGNPIDNTAATASRGYAGSAGMAGVTVDDERFNSLHLLGDKSWELKLANGRYSVMAVFGDTSTSLATGNDISIEGISFLDADYGKVEDTDVFLGEVSVADGALTISGNSPTAAIMYIQLTSLDGPFYMSIPGDANCDNVVNEDDAKALAENWLRSVAVSWGDGDFNGDGKVDDIDAAMMAANWLKSVSSASVPEPCMSVLMLAAICAGLFLRVASGKRSRNMLRLICLLVFAATAVSAYAAVSPGNLSGLTAWYKADSITGLAGGDAVSVWEDSGLYGYDITQANPANQAVWIIDGNTNMPGIVFDSADFYTGGNINLDGPSGFTVVAMVQAGNTGCIASKFMTTGNGREWRMTGSYFDTQQNPAAWNANNYALSTAPLTTNPTLIAGRWAPSTLTEIRYNNVQVGTATTPAASMTDTMAAIFTVGADYNGTGNRFLGLVHELAFFNRSLSDVELTELQDYFTAKYPYSTTPPQPTQPSFIASVNFQPAGASVNLPSNYVVDTGETFRTHGDFRYGWSRDMSSYARSPSSSQLTDPRDFTNDIYDTVINTSADGAPATWEIEVPNGTYWVRTLFGEPRVGVVRGNFSAHIEDKAFTDPRASFEPTTQSTWTEHFGKVTVSDGRLSVASSLLFEVGENPVTGEPIFYQATSKLASIQIQEANIPDIAISFQRSVDLKSQLYEADCGEAYGARENGLTFGWLDDNGTPLNNTAETRSRGTAFAPDGFNPGDIRFATFCHMYGNKWEIEVENGTYSFMVICGEPDGSSYSRNFVDIEGVRFDDPDYTYPRPDFDYFMGTVEVADGRFTIDGVNDTLAVNGGAPDNKLVYLELTRLASVSTVPEPGVMVLLLSAICLFLMRGSRR